MDAAPPQPAETPDDDRRAAPRTDIARRSHHDVIYAFARAAEEHHPDTGDHLHRIRMVVERLASRMGVADAEELGYDAMLHDVGKLLVPVAILGKPGGLDANEREQMEAHTLHGEGLLRHHPSMARAARIARSHHERWDGSGYPDGLSGGAIPLEARITAVADMVDALAADREYKDAWPYRHAVEQVRSLAGTKLDPDVVRALERCDDDGVIEKLYA